MANDDVKGVIDSLGAEPNPKVLSRAKQEVDQVLSSGRTPLDLTEVVSELAEIMQDQWSTDEYLRFPPNLRRSLVAQAAGVASALQSYAEGQIGAQDLENRVDQLHSALWQNNLVDRLDRLPGLERKNKNLEFLKNKGRRIVRELRKGLETVKALEEHAEVVAQLRSAGEEHVTSAKASLKSTTDSEAQASTTLEALRSSADEGARIEKQAASALARAETTTNEVDALKQKITTFHGEITERQTELKGIIQTAERTVRENNEHAKSHGHTLIQLEKRIEEQLQKATGASLFHSFNERRKRLSIAKWIWAGLTIFSLGFAVWWGLFLSDSAGDPDSVFLVKLGATVPLLVVIGFCLAQYGRERKTEEEYAFKSVLALSLIPFKDLIEGLEQEQHSTEYAQFLVRTVEQIYEAPRLSKDDVSRDEEWISVGVLDRIIKAVERVLSK